MSCSHTQSAGQTTQRWLILASSPREQILLVLLRVTECVMKKPPSIMPHGKKSCTLSGRLAGAIFQVSGWGGGSMHHLRRHVMTESRNNAKV